MGPGYGQADGLEMIDVFVRAYGGEYLRRAMQGLVQIRLNQIADIRVMLMEGGVVPEPFHIESKRLAERAAKSDIYCVMDDDQLPIPDDFFEQGARALEQNRDYGMVAGFPLEYALAGQPYADWFRSGVPHPLSSAIKDVIDAHSIGCPYFVRKGTLKTFPDCKINEMDGELSKVVTDQGLKTGLVRGALYNHLGFGFSQVEKLIT